jgi:hypothetical protein
LLAAATYFFIERPLHRIALPDFRRRWAPAAMLAMAITALAGIQIPRSEWALSRFPPAVRALLTFNTGENKFGKGKGCFLRPGRGPSHFLAKCVDPPAEKHPPLLLLWGDSHAAHLVPAFRALQKEKETRGFRLARYTAAGCPAVLAEMPGGKECAEVNRFVMDRISALKPDIVVIAGFWYHYTLPKSKKHFWMLNPSALADTVRRIKGAGVKQVVFVGELPAWKIFQPVISAELLITTGKVPERTKLRLDPRSLSIDREIKAKVTDAGATFISPADLLCDSRGCAIKAGESPVYVDKDHLTAAGAQLLVRPILRAVNLLQPGSNSMVEDFATTVPRQ